MKLRSGDASRFEISYVNFLTSFCPSYAVQVLDGGWMAIERDRCTDLRLSTETLVVPKESQKTSLSFQKLQLDEANEEYPFDH